MRATPGHVQGSADTCEHRGFKALKQSTKLNFARGRHADALVTYEELLGYTKSAVTRNYSCVGVCGCSVPR